MSLGGTYLDFRHMRFFEVYFLKHRLILQPQSQNLAVKIGHFYGSFEFSVEISKQQSYHHILPEVFANFIAFAEYKYLSCFIDSRMFSFWRQVLQI